MEVMNCAKTEALVLREAEAVVREGLREVKERERKERRRRQGRYFLRQRMAGIILLLVTLPGVVALHSDVIAVVTLVPIAAYLMFQRNLGRVGRNKHERSKQKY